MEALTSSASNIFAEYNPSKTILSSKTLSNRPQKCSFPFQKSIGVASLHSFPLHIKTTESVRCLSMDKQVGLENEDAVQAGHDTADDQVQVLFFGEDQAQVTSKKTVHVRFQLQKECVYGQRFLIVGDDPIFGMWDPSCAVPLKWSDGNMWALELDMLVGKTLQFKFLLEGNKGDVVWQPGPDRLVHIWETQNLIIVSEQWENAEKQIVREVPLNYITLEPIATENSPKPNAEGDFSCHEEEPISSANSELIDSDSTTHPENDHVVIAEKITYPNGHMVDLGNSLQTSANITCSHEEGISNSDKKFMIAQNILDSNGEL